MTPPPPVPSGVEVRTAQDFGPATKLLPALGAADTDDALILYCDDDKIYKPRWAEGLVRAASAAPLQAHAWAGCGLAEIRTRHLARRGLDAQLTALSGGLLQPLKWRRPRHGPIDIAFGYGGVAVRPRFFAPSVFALPPGCLVDDIWISGQLAVTGTAIHKLPGPAPIANRRSAERAPLKSETQHGLDRAAADDETARYLADNYGVWR